MSSTFMNDYMVMRLLSEMGENIGSLSSHSEVLLTKKSVVDMLEKDPKSRDAFSGIQKSLLEVGDHLDQLVQRAIDLDDTQYLTDDGCYFTNEAWQVIAVLLQSKLMITVTDFMDVCERRFKRHPGIRRATQHLIKQKLISRSRSPYYGHHHDTGQIHERITTVYSLTELGRKIANDCKFQYNPQFGPEQEIRERSADILKFPSK